VIYIPKQGDFISLSFDPQAGHEQKGRRPAFVISKTLFNQHTGLAIVCPLTNTDRKIPFHVPVPVTTSLTGFIMIEQVKSIDYKARNARFIKSASEDLLSEVLSILDTFFF